MGSDSADGVIALRGTIVTCRDDPFLTDQLQAFSVEADGVVLCRNGMIEAVGPARPLLATVRPDRQQAKCKAQHS